MPRVSKQDVEGFAFCRNARCPGYVQERVPAERVTSEWSYVENGGDMPGVEKSQVYVQFRDYDADSPCSHCGEARSITDTERPVYAPVSGFPQDGLLLLRGQGVKFDPARQAELAAGGGEVAELRAQIAELRALLSEKAAA